MSQRARESGPTDRAQRELERFVERVTDTSRPADDTADLDAAAVQVLDAFDSAGVDALLLKGAALTRLLYGPGERRTYVDVDLLVAPGDLPQAAKALTGLGFRNADAVLGIDDVGEVVHEQSWVGAPPGTPHELVLELHLRLAGAQAAPEKAWEALWAHRTAIELEGRDVPVLDRSGLALHLALHAAQHGVSYGKGLRELSLGLERWPQAVWRQAWALAVDVGASERFAAGLRLVPAGAELARELALPATERLDWEMRSAADRPRGTFHLEALAQARGVHARGDILRRALLPSRQWIVWQHPWARAGGVRMIAAYAVHLMRAPAWALRAWRFWRRSRRSAGPPSA